MEYNFLPYWLKQKEKRKKYIAFFTIIIGLAIVNIYLLHNFVDMCIKIDNLKVYEDKSNLWQKKLSQTQSQSETKDKTKMQVGTYRNFETFMGSMSSYYDLCTLKIKGKDINASFKVKDSLEYEDLIRKIESDSEYKILNLGVPKFNADGNDFFKIDIEVVK